MSDDREERYLRAFQRIQKLREGSRNGEDERGFQEPLGFLVAIKSGFVKFLNTETRASRSEVWYWTLFLFLLSAAYTIPATYMTMIPPMKIVEGEPMENGKEIMKTGLMTLMIGGLVMKILWWPTAAMWMRRFHDLNWSAWIALGLCVFDLVLGTRFASSLFPEPQGVGMALFTDVIRHIGALSLLAINFKPGVEESNEYGPPFRRRDDFEPSDEEPTEEFDESL